MSARLTDADRALRAITEAQHQRAVCDALSLLGWRWQHQRPGINARGRYMTAVSGDVGVPDIVAVRGERLLFIECKRIGGRLSPDQEEWRRALEGVPSIEYWLSTPANLDALIDALRQETR